MKKQIVFILFLSHFFGFIYAQKVEITDKKFTVDGNEIWFNGINIPWIGFGSFGRQDWNEAKWDQQFSRCKENHVNLIRVWFHCAGEFDPTIDDNGFVSGANTYFWANVDKLMNLAKKHEIYIMPALFSFDIVKTDHTSYSKWNKWIVSKNNVQSYIDNVLNPLVAKYDNNDYLLGWEICNEPEWLGDNQIGSHDYRDMIRFHGMMAAAIHKKGTKPVTTGSAGFKWNSPIAKAWNNVKYPPVAGHLWAADSLKKYSGEELAYLDFYQVHWYPWQIPNWEPPYTSKGTPDYYQINDRPIIIGETEGKNVDIKDQSAGVPYAFKQTLSEMYENAYKNGYDGVCAWMTLENDGHGTFDDIQVATNDFYKKHETLVDPKLIPIPLKGIGIETQTLSIEVNDDYPLQVIYTPAKASNKKVVYTLENDKLNIDQNGVIKGLKIGSCVVTAKSVDGNYEAKCTVTITKDLPPKPYTLSITKNGNGTVISNPDGASIMEGTQVTLTASDAQGFAFENWTGDYPSSNSTITFIMKRNTNVTANFFANAGICGDAVALTEKLFRKENYGGSHCFVLYGSLNHINSWNSTLLEVNGVNFTNKYESANFPSAINGKYYIHYESGANGGIEIQADVLNQIPTKNSQVGQTAASVKAYPNPFTNEITLEFTNPDEITNIKVLNQLGSLLEIIDSNFTHKMAVGNHYNSGIYYLLITTKTSQKVISIVKH